MNPNSDHEKRKLPLVVDCRGCGACCQHMGYPSYIQGDAGQPAEEHWVNMPGDLKAELLRFVASYAQPSDGELDGVCCWYDADQQRCKHHEHRPNVCRDFEVGSDDCLAWRDVYAI